MNIGDKILELRKKKNLSQEQLAEKVGVTRQTISNWELNDSSPDLKQAKELSNIFETSLDEIVDNNLKNILVEKVSNTEKLAGMVIKILKVFGILIVVYLVLFVTAILCFTVFRKETSTSDIKSATLSCSIENNDYLVTIGSDGYFNCSNCDKKMQVYLNDITDWANIDHGVENIEKYFSLNGGDCERK